MKETAGLGIVETKSAVLFSPPRERMLESGEKAGPVTIAYETYGTLNPAGSNAILIAHALSGNAHAAGFHEGDAKPGWWDNMIGPGKAFDTDRYFVICSNVLGGCAGSTGPASIDPRTGEPYGTEFPLVGIHDMVDCQKELCDLLGIGKLLSVTGGSMGGMQALSWLTRYPARVGSGIPIATTMRHSPQQIAFSEIGRQAIMSDPNWNNGRYYGRKPPAKGLSLARMIGHITYMSDESMRAKFGRGRKFETQASKLVSDFLVEGYLRYKGEGFLKRFDANSYLYLLRALDDFDATNGRPAPEVFAGLEAKILVIAFESDWLYPIWQSKEIVRAAESAGVDVRYCEIPSTYGHDAFLLEAEEQTPIIRRFLEEVSGTDQVI
jgi:homoserine O-acetyltransferase/O-succinyltransferase